MQPEILISDFVKEKTGIVPETVERLTGDASDRAYYRIAAPGSAAFANRDTGIIMLMNGPQPEDLPFVSMQRLLHGIGVPVPLILASALDRGLLLLDDLGDITLMQSVNGADIGTWRSFYRRSIDIMAGIQIHGAGRCTDDCPCFALAFDEEKLMFELNFFIENALCIFKRACMAPPAEAALREEFVRVCGILAAEQRYLCHRDYHSRNIMVRDGELYVIDFQDARMGPLQYDLVSLLCDSYVDMPPGLDAELYDYYLDELPRLGGPAQDRERFSYIYDVMVLQRNLKAAGSFAYLDCVKNMNRYLCRMGECMSHVKKSLDRRPEFERLRDILGEYFPELK